jgi:hypothetical protein
VKWPTLSTSRRSPKLCAGLPTRDLSVVFRTAASNPMLVPVCSAELTQMYSPDASSACSLVERNPLKLAFSQCLAVVVSLLIADFGEYGTSENMPIPYGGGIRKKMDACSSASLEITRSRVKTHESHCLTPEVWAQRAKGHGDPTSAALEGGIRTTFGEGFCPRAPPWLRIVAPPWLWLKYCACSAHKKIEYMRYLLTPQ